MEKIKDIPVSIRQRLGDARRCWRDNVVIRRKAAEIARHLPTACPLRPVIFSKASSSLGNFTYNTAFNMLSAWGLRLQGVSVIRFVCNRGMQPCVMGTDCRKPASLHFDAFLTTSDHPSLTHLKEFSWQELLPENSPAVAAILDGVLQGGDFTLKA